MSRLTTSMGQEDIAAQTTRGELPATATADDESGGTAHNNNNDDNHATSSATTGRSNNGSDVTLGPLVRLWGIGRDELPSETATRDELRPFLVAVLAEAAPFIASASADTDAEAAPGTAWKQARGDKRSRDSEAPVARSSRVVDAQELDRLIGVRGAWQPGPSQSTVRARRERHRRGGRETWFCRRSVHEDAARRGTASWDEFDRYHRLEHAQAEAQLSPAVVAAHEAVRWRGCEGIEVELGASSSGDGDVWRDFSLSIQEMRHKVGRPVLRDRTFPLLQMTCRRVTGAPASKSSAAGPGHHGVLDGHGPGSEAAAAGGQEFLVVSIPVPDFGEDPRSRLSSEAGAQVAVYASVERVRQTGRAGQIEWVMATASDAGGVVPSWVQAAAVPGMLWKDAPMFFSWLVTQRGRDA
ncbi:DUF3074 domain-containing protein [Microdochium nivale]|nr:DUF3074 domain-containing protein [Microdochium nivale]